MKKILIVINSYSNNINIKYKSEHIKEEVNKYGFKCDILKANDLIFISDGNNVYSSLLKEYSLCFYLDKDNYLAKAISFYMPLYNSYESLVLSDDKMLSILNLKDQGIKCPLTISNPLCYVEDPNENEVDKFLNKVETSLSYPLVLKLVHGSLGKQVFLINNKEELKKNYYSYKNLPHIYEEFVSYKKGDDYRLIVVGDEVIAAMERINKNDFRSNIALGGKGFDATSTISKEYIDTALKASRALKLDYAGIDLAIGKNNEPIFLEANGNAFFTEIEKVTNINIASHLVEYVLSKEKLI